VKVKKKKDWWLLYLSSSLHSTPNHVPDYHHYSTTVPFVLI
jgi:hypothetical protein